MESNSLTITMKPSSYSFLSPQAFSFLFCDKLGKEPVFVPLLLTHFALPTFLVRAISMAPLQDKGPRSGKQEVQALLFIVTFWDVYEMHESMSGMSWRDQAMKEGVAELAEDDKEMGDCCYQLGIGKAYS